MNEMQNYLFDQVNDNQNKNSNQQKLVEEPEINKEISKISANPKIRLIILVSISSILILISLLLFSNFKSTSKIEKGNLINVDSTVAADYNSQSNSMGRSVPEQLDLPQINSEKEDVLLKLVEEKNNVPLPPNNVENDEKQKKLNENKNKLSAFPGAEKEDVKINKNDNLIALPGTERTKLEDLNIPFFSNDDIVKIRERKRKSSILLVNNTRSVAPSTIEPDTEKQKTKIYPVELLDKRSVDYLLEKGKVIEAVIETSIDSNMQGEIRAVISKDVLSYSGKSILIPKGSRIFGKFSGIDAIYNRISVAWDRVDLANGYILNFEGITVDNLGRQGTAGYTDYKYKEQLSNQIVSSALNIALGTVVDKIIPPASDQNQTLKNQDLINAIRNNTLTIQNNSAYDDNRKVTEICSSLKMAIQDKGSEAYRTITSACDSAASGNNGANASQKLISLLQQINSLTDSLSRANIINEKPSKTQQQAEQGFNEITNIIKSVLPKDLKVATSLAQGQVIRIYITKDYSFPPDIAYKQRGVRR